MGYTLSEGDLNNHAAVDMWIYDSSVPAANEMNIITSDIADAGTYTMTLTL